MVRKTLHASVVIVLTCILAAIMMLILDRVTPIVANTGTLFVAPDADCGPTHTPCYASIQGAVDAASAGDTIKVATGLYTEVKNIPSLNTIQWGTHFTATQIAAITKSLALLGGYSIANWDIPDPVSNPTILDAQEEGRCLYIKGQASVSGFRITGGNAIELGGDPWSGGSDHGVGGGIYILGSGATIVGNEIYSNTAQKGGGIFVRGGTATLNDNFIFDNVATINGGGVDLRFADSTFNNNIIQDNVAFGWGGGMQSYGSDASLTANIIRNNTAHNGGGGVFVFSAGYSGNPIQFINNALIGNSVIAPNGPGSAVAVSLSAHPSFIHTTFAQNTGGDGSAIALKQNSTVSIVNSVFVSHSVGITVGVGCTATMNGILWHNNHIDYDGAGIIGASNTYTGDPAFAADGYHLTNASAAIGRGIESGVISDIDGQPRPINGHDLGADEIMPNVSVNQTTGATLVFTDIQGIVSNIIVPAGAVDEPTNLLYVPVFSVSVPTGFAFTGRAFDLEAYRDNTPLHNLVFNTPVTLTIHYASTDIIGDDETKLQVLTWDENQNAWVEAACGDYVRDLYENWLSIPICHLSRFALFAEQPEYRVYLPLVSRNP